MSGSFATRQNSAGVGTSAKDIRMMLAAFCMNDGIVSGLTVNGNSNLTYAVSAGVGVVSRASADGRRVFNWTGGNTGAVPAGDASNPRIDIVWVKADDPDFDSDSNAVHVGVTSGTPAANPTAPQLQSGQLKLAQFTVSAGATNLSTGASQAADHDYVIPYGALLGKLGENWNKADMTGDSTVKKHYVEQPITFYLPTDRMVEFHMSVNFSAQDVKLSEWTCMLQLDGARLDHAGWNWASGQSWESHEGTYQQVVLAGWHTAMLETFLQYGSAPVFHYLTDGDHLAMMGRRFQIFDKGPVK